ncbi:MAG: hypothetical protein HY960_11410 [Ignavibacteriae bacterium]|nr:hypothetical protein [Ignavibacteriota bacterium]
MKLSRYFLAVLIALFFSSTLVAVAQQETVKQKKKQAYELREKKKREGKAPVHKGMQKRKARLNQEKSKKEIEPEKKADK